MDIQFLQQIKEFIQFKFFIAEDVLTVFYVICAILIPFASWYFLLWVIRRYAVVIQFYKDSSYSIIFSFIMWIVRKIKFFKNKIDEKITWQSLTLTQKLKFILLFIMLVGMSELFLRLIFEYLIAYMQMHEYLKPIAIS
ncbi:MAG: DUF4282 domain-containing protein [Gammaproteobacteria bacterium]|nr:DUF4282 domain-containing protein [Gammaproteobacteria bacterium]MBT4859608.1 DUF4282 domain-containing protein [Gammaproteobacteria bacterium]MBT6455973.1 DUF4282 domain-containing protein [Gammaproteobacteria bacterium]MBT7046309.1 DUF4282 domain-containing protein [Gammaproteobacteria bacterium]